jgi:hypothetical protein
MRKRSLLAPADTSALRIASPTTFLNDPSDEVAPPAPFLNDSASVGFDVGGLRGEGAFAFGAFAGELLACDPPCAAVPLSAFLPGDARPTSSFFDGV